MKPPSMPLHQLHSERPGTIHDVSANSSGSGAGLTLVIDVGIYQCVEVAGDDRDAPRGDDVA